MPSRERVRSLQRKTGADRRKRCFVFFLNEEPTEGTKCPKTDRPPISLEECQGCEREGIFDVTIIQWIMTRDEELPDESSDKPEVVAGDPEISGLVREAGEEKENKKERSEEPEGRWSGYMEYIRKTT